MRSDTLRRYSVLLLSFLMFIFSQFYRSSVAVITPNLIADLGLETRGLSLVSASFFYAFALTQIPIGLYLDNIGPRILMTLLSLVAVAGALVFAWGQSLAMLVAGRLLLGMGMACNFMGTLKLITLWFTPPRFATLAAVAFSIGMIGSMTAATPLVLLVEAFGWRLAFTVFGGLNLLVTIVFFMVVRDSPSPARPTGASGAMLAGLSETVRRVGDLFRIKDYWIISFGTFCRYGITAAVQALWAGPYLMTVLGLSPVAAGNVLFCMSLGLVAGCPVAGYFSDALLCSRKKIIIAGLAGMALILAVLACLPVGSGAGLLAVLFFTFAVFSSTGQIMYAHIKECMPIERAGTAMTGINFFTMVGVAVFLQGLGSFMQRLYPDASLGQAAFRGAFFLCAAFLAITAGLYLLTRETLGARKA